MRGQPEAAGNQRMTEPVSGVAHAGPDPVGAGEPAIGSCTLAQLRRFIKSRPYVPLHELRRRFGLNGAEDEVSSLDVQGRRVFVGLPEREGRILSDLVQQGEVGCELLLDPSSPMVVGVFPMRPVQRS